MKFSRTIRVAAVLVCASVLALSAGCAKKQVKNANEGALSGAQDAAMRGDDIALSDTNLNFVEPYDTVTFRDIYFNYDSSDIRPDAKPVLANISRWLNSNPSKHLLIEGHCDERGTKEYNLALGEQRALSARRYLVGLGIGDNRLHTITYGEERPIAPAHNEPAWTKNRRSHFLISE